MSKLAPLGLFVILAAAPLNGAPGAPGSWFSIDLSEPANARPTAKPAPPPADPSLLQRLVEYTQFSLKHRVSGLASYYSSFFDGRKTASGEVFRNSKYSAAHLTLPLGTWIEVTSKATGRKLRMRVNDRGPYTRKFCLDLSQAAARYLGVDTARDRRVDVRIVALPGEEPLPEDLNLDAPPAVTAAPAAGVPVASVDR